MLFLLTNEKTEQTLNSFYVCALVACNSTCQLLSFTAFVANKITVLPPFMPLRKCNRFVVGLAFS